MTPVKRNDRQEWIVLPPNSSGAEEGDVVIASPLKHVQRPRHPNQQYAQVLEILGKADNPKTIPLLTLATHAIPTRFAKEAFQEAQEIKDVPALGKRQDLRHLPIVTIDGEDAKDFDDAVYAEPDPDPINIGGWHIIVAIADVSYYVRPESAIDKEASKRGNSVYFPGYVTPMLPEILSNNLCSLRPDEDRATLSAHMWINKRGKIIRYKMHRSLIRSQARLTYKQVQEMHDTNSMPEHVANLYGAFKSLLKARFKRGTLDLDIPERTIALNEEGHPIAIKAKERFDSHRLIEEFMIAANVTAAMVLEERKAPVVYRVHDLPPSLKLEALRETLQGLGFNLAKGQTIKPRSLMQIISLAHKTPHSQMVSDLILRSQSQATYTPFNIGHFGLNLPKYAHFTSPIRRYADLLVHRSLVTALELGEGGFERASLPYLEEMSSHISQTERKAALAEREVKDRYTALYLQNSLGQTFKASISGVSSFGFFVSLSETGADGLVRLSSLADDYYLYVETTHQLIGRRTRKVYALGQTIEVVLQECDPITGTLSFTVTTPSNKPKKPKKLDTLPKENLNKLKPKSKRVRKKKV